MEGACHLPRNTVGSLPQPRVCRPTQVLLTATCFLALLALLLWSRTGGLDLGLWNDEAYSVVKYIDPGPEEIFGSQYVPNNHVLFSLLAWHAAETLGRTERVYRLWSVVPGMFAVVIACVFAWRRLGAATATAFAFLCVVSPVHLDLAPQARGYGLAFLAGAAILAGGVAATERPRRAAGWLLLASGGWLGIATLPVFVLPFVGQILAVTLRRGRRLGAILVLLVVTAGSLWFYRDLLPQILAAREQRFGAPLVLGKALIAPFFDLLVPVSSTAPRRMSTAAAIMGAVFVAFGAWRLVRRNELGLLANVALPVVTTYLALWALHLYVVPRFTSYLLFNLLLLLALGIVQAGQRIAAQVGAAATAFLASMVVGFVLVPFYLLVRESHAIPIEAYKDVAVLIRTLGIERGVTNSLYSVGFDHYLPRFLEYPPPGRLPASICGASERVAFVDYPLRGNGADTGCLARQDVTRYAVPQRAGGREGWMTVWIIEPGDGGQR